MQWESKHVRQKHVRFDLLAYDESCQNTTHNDHQKKEKIETWTKIRIVQKALNPLVKFVCKTALKSLFRAPPVYHDLSTRYDWPVTYWKKPLLICQPGGRELNRNAFPVIRSVRWGLRTRISALLPTLLTGLRLRLRRRLHYLLLYLIYIAVYLGCMTFISSGIRKQYWILKCKNISYK